MPSFDSVRRFSRFTDIPYLASRPSPTASDGQYDVELNADEQVRSESKRSWLNNTLGRMRSHRAKGSINFTPHDIKALVDEVLHPDAVNDRLNGFALILDILATLPQKSDVHQLLAHKGLVTLYNSVPHPPSAFLGPKHYFRSPDGGGNNIHDVDLGRAGMPYARSVRRELCISPCALPDPGLVFDVLLKRRGVVPHPSGISSFTFAFATLVTHSVFRTNPREWWQNDTSSYLDLGPLYGHNKDEQNAVRDKEQGRGLMWPDTFSEERILFLPPAASAILVILCRNHNYIAERLLKINEGGKWEDPPPNEEACKKQDEEIFQTARLINCGHFMSLILGDYAASFLGLDENRFWDIKAFETVKLDDGTLLPSGQGNHVSVEFNLLYRWHATLSEEDEKWTQRAFDRVFEGKAYSEITVKDFGHAIAKKVEQLEPQPQKRTFGGLKRTNGKFDDDDIARILLDATKAPGGAWRGQGVPEVLRIVEILGIIQARSWGVCTMNEFRKFLHLKPFTSFEEWNSHSEIADAARQLYGHIDHLELYAGLQAEETMPVKPGSHIAAGYTTTRAVLGDAIAMIRGDRYYTTDFTPTNLTAWGYQDCQRHKNNGGFGSEMPKLLLRHLPRHYSYHNVHSLFPFFTPEHMGGKLEQLKIKEKYTFERPPVIPVPIFLDNFTAINHVFSDKASFKNSYEKNEPTAHGILLSLTSAEKASNHDSDRLTAFRLLFSEDDSRAKYQEWCRKDIGQKIASHTHEYSGAPGKYIDIVYAINAVVTNWVAGLCGLSLKPEDPTGLFTEHEFYEKLTTLYSSIYLSIDDPEHAFAWRSEANDICGELEDLIVNAFTRTSPRGTHSTFVRCVSFISGMYLPMPRENHRLLAKLATTGKSLEDRVAIVMSLALGMSVSYAHAAVLAIDFYLSDEARCVSARADILQLVNSEDDSALERLAGYAREAMRLRPECPGLYRDVVNDTDIPHGETKPSIHVKKGDRVWASIEKAHLDPVEFPEPETIDPTRPKAFYHLAPTSHLNCPGSVAYAQVFVTEALRAVFRLKNVRRATGGAGELSKFTTVMNETDVNVYLKSDGLTSPFPGPMKLVYDA